MRKKKRSDVSQEEIDRYVQEYAEVFSEYRWDRIGNMDETPFNFVFLRGVVLAEKGKEEVAAQLPEDYRKTFTTIATIRADGHKFPPIFLAQGKTIKCTSQFSEMKSPETDYELYFSPGGNTDENVMLHYLTLYSQWMKNEPCVLILDRYTSHVTEEVKLKAEGLKIRLVFIPTSATETFQPLDSRIFGMVKSIAAAKFNDRAFEEHTAYTKSEAADLFIEAWKQVKSHHIINAWDKCEKFGEEVSDKEEEDDQDFQAQEEEEYEEEDIGDVDEEDLILIQENKHEERRNRGRITPPRPYQTK